MCWTKCYNPDCGKGIKEEGQFQIIIVEPDDEGFVDTRTHYCSDKCQLQDRYPEMKKKVVKPPFLVNVELVRHLKTECGPGKLAMPIRRKIFDGILDNGKRVRVVSRTITVKGKLVECNQVFLCWKRSGTYYVNYNQNEEYRLRLRKLNGS